METADVVIIGGGIAGVSTAFHLAGHGHTVTLLERGEIGGEASGVNNGSISAMGWSLDSLETTLGHGSLEIFRALQLDLGHDIGFRQSGTLRAISTEAQWAYAGARLALQPSRVRPIARLDIRAARSLEPALAPSLLGALYLPDNAQADPRPATRALADAAVRRGARLSTGSPVTGLAQHHDRSWRIETPARKVAASRLVIAAGAWSAQLGTLVDLAIPVVPVRGQMWETGPLPPRLFHTIGSLESALHWHEHPDPDPGQPPRLTHQGARRLTRHLYGRQTREGRIMFGGDRELGGDPAAPDPSGIAVNHAHAGEVLPLLRELPVARCWAGLMPFTLDGHPLIGRVPELETLYLLTGLASSGFGQGPMAGRLLAEHLHTGVRPLELAPADPAGRVRVGPPGPGTARLEAGLSGTPRR